MENIEDNNENIKDSIAPPLAFQSIYFNSPNLQNINNKDDKNINLFSSLSNINKTNSPPNIQNTVILRANSGLISEEIIKFILFIINDFKKLFKPSFIFPKLQVYFLF